MKKNIIVFIILLTCPLSANDGAFFTDGNHLIPISENTVSLKKEILTITKVGDNYFKVMVEYELFNPQKAKTVLTGFEASSPSGDVDGTPRNGGHPYINNFKVIVNGELVAYKKAIVTDQNYYANNNIKSKTVKQVTGKDFDSNNPGFYYVYYFSPVFRKGKNTITHTYRFNISGSVMNPYTLGYVLTAANRWSNRQIDDFTLVLYLDKYEAVSIKKTFFRDPSGWQVDGTIIDDRKHAGTIQVFPKTGKLTFRKKNFRPSGELSLIKYRYYYTGAFNYVEHTLPYSISDSLSITSFADTLSYKILRNLPFARRGYIFKSKAIQKYYNAQKWYRPDRTYKATKQSLTEEEAKWLTDIDSVYNKKG